MKLVECVPNFSEGRRPEVIEAITAAIASVDGVVILDTSSDPSHNRTVVTFVAPATAAVQAAFNGIAKARELIDLTAHTGEHPRIGATDVCPFIPLEGATMDDCIALARELGAKVGTELGIPVFLYEKAATRADRENLADIRRGEFELARTEIGTNPNRVPDFGPHAIHPTAGATVIGADLKELAGTPGGWTLNIGGFGEILPYHDNKVTIDKSKKDKNGLPVLICC